MHLLYYFCAFSLFYWRINVELNFDLESSVRVTCDVNYLCANFGYS